MRHQLPNGEQTTVPMLSPEEFGLLAQPYSEWAPAPFNQRQVRAESAVNLFMMSFTGFADMFDLNALLSGRFQGPSSMDHELAFCRARSWAGLVPLSDRRWRQKDLDSPQNWDKALQHLEKACDGFMYMCVPQTARKMRQAYNKVYDILEHFDTVLDAYYRSSSSAHETRTGAKAKDLWGEYFFSLVTFISARTHAWFTEHADALYRRLEEWLLRAVPALSRGVGPAGERELLKQRFELLANMQTKADASILVPLVGYKNELPRWRRLASPPLVNWTRYDGSQPLEGFPSDVLERLGAYDKRQRFLVRRALDGNHERIGIPHSDNGGDPLADGLRRYFDVPAQAFVTARRELRASLEEPSEIRGEMWVSKLKWMLDTRPVDAPGPAAPAHQYDKWGFVGYQISYGYSPDEWARFVASFNVNVVEGWGEGVAGINDVIKSKCEIRWIDGRDHGIAEGDIEAARRHFSSLVPVTRFLTIQAFLVADKASIDSYLNKPVLPGQNLVDAADLGSFILVADQEFNPDRVPPNEAPGWDGSVRVLGSVLFDDVWASMFERIHSNLWSFWPIAGVHPFGVYMGPYTHYQVENWKKLDSVKLYMVFKAKQWERQGRLGSRSPSA
ncbi:hypothetical protein B0H66DRAFT_253040 [Apodospora peruviana]|uniref:Uncharacterized protein n=1 Tax=Apodospora peruviana TaxID=516989 RepID=A0AAE0M4D3_9PEZI|nr:hypothetical protein B0H66DRAFT_253040 [Apodospora peruviana]